MINADHLIAREKQDWLKKRKVKGASKVLKVVQEFTEAQRNLLAAFPNLDLKQFENDNLATFKKTLESQVSTSEICHFLHIPRNGANVRRRKHQSFKAYRDFCIDYYIDGLISGTIKKAETKYGECGCKSENQHGLCESGSSWNYQWTNVCISA